MNIKFNLLNTVIKWNAIISSLALIIALIAGIIKAVEYLSEDEFDISDYRNELELRYWHTKSEIVDEVQNYIDRNAPGSDLSAIVVVNACDEYNVDLKFVLVQGLVESHFGTKGLAVKTNSVWNAWAYDGLSYNEIDSKGIYKHPDHSVRPYLKLLTTRYLVGGKTETDLLDNFVDVDGNRYASYPKYESELKLRLDEFNNSRLDSLLIVIHKQKLRLNR